MNEFTDLLQSVTDLAVKVLGQGADKLSAQLGAEASAAMLGAWSWLKGRLLARPAAAEAVRELEAAPADADNQGAFRQQLRKALAEDAELAAGLAERLRAVATQHIALTQTATQTGDGNVAVQIAGGSSGNQVTLH